MVGDALANAAPSLESLELSAWGREFVVLYVEKLTGLFNLQYLTDSDSSLLTVVTAGRGT